MKLKDFKFNESHIKTNIVRNENLFKKINHSIDYLSKHLPINILNKDNTFDFNNLKFNEGKNYNWFFLNNDNVTMLIRQYREHFTFFVSCDLNDYNTHSSVFSISENRDKMTDEQNDSFCDDNFQGIREYLPTLITMVEEDLVHCLWNDHSFKIPKYTEVKIATSSRDSIDSLDLLIFACDELFSTYLCTYAENDVLEQIKGFKVGDMFGDNNEITRVNTELKKFGEPDYYCVGLEFKDVRQIDVKPTWNDIYSLAMYHYSELDHKTVLIEREVLKSLSKNHNKVMKILTTGKQEAFIWMYIDSKYIDVSHGLYVKNGGKLELKPFSRAVSSKYRDFIKMSYRITQN